MDFLERLKEHMEGLIFTPSTVEIGSHNKDGESVAIRPAPSNTDDRYMEGGKIYPFSFQLLVHNKNSYTAWKVIQDILKVYDMPKETQVFSSDGSFVLTSIRCTTNPNHVEDTNYGSLYTAIFEADLYIPN